MFYGGIAGGVVLVQLAPNRASSSLLSYLFGSLLTTSTTDLVTIVALSVAVLLVTVIGRPWLFAVCHDEEYARVAGLPVRALNLTLAITTAVTVTMAMRAVGLLLVSALMVVPVATAQLVTRGFRATMYAAMGIGLAAAGSGVGISSYGNTSPGATIVLLAIVLFFGVAVGSAIARALRRRGVRLDPPVAEAGEPAEHAIRLAR
jgi:zinc transport system permease protein